METGQLLVQVFLAQVELFSSGVFDWAGASLTFSFGSRTNCFSAFFRANAEAFFSSKAGVSLVIGTGPLAVAAVACSIFNAAFLAAFIGTPCALANSGFTVSP